MKAAVFRNYGPPEVLRIEELPKPLPNENEILVRVNATTVCAADWRFRKAAPALVVRPMIGLLRPKKFNVPGLEFAGTVEAAGAQVTKFAAGERIFGSTGFAMGAHAEFVRVPETRLLARIPAGVSDEQAAAIPFGGISALYFLRCAGIARGQDVLVYGASGSVGTYAVQLAKHFGANVTGVCSTANIDLVESLGADHVIDYTRTSFARDGRVYDIVFDAVGKAKIRDCLYVLKRGGRVATAAMGFSTVAGSAWAKLTGVGTVISGIARSQEGDLGMLAELVATGTIKPVIDRRYLLPDIAAAHRYVEAGHKRGQVVITIA